MARKPRYTPSPAPADKHGFTIIALLAQSPISLHTWPEYGYLVLDIFTGGDQKQADPPAEHFLQRLRPGRVNRQVLSRGFHRSPQDRRYPLSLPLDSGQKGVDGLRWIGY